MRGEAENKCFELLKTFLDKDVFFAMSYDDKCLVKKAFDYAKPNSQQSKFPDFIFEGGFIEHFQVTSSYENRKGSTMERENNNINLNFQSRAKEVVDNLPERNITIYSVETPQYWYRQHSYENFVNSFKGNLEHHIESLIKYDGIKKYKIFMIEYNDSALYMSKKYPGDLMLNISYGDLLTVEKSPYRLSRDKILLDYIYNNRDMIDYVIFIDKNDFQGVFVDIIKSQNALEIIKLLYEGYNFHCSTIGMSQFGIGVSVPHREGDADL